MYKTKTLYKRHVSRLVFTPDPVISNLVKKEYKTKTQPSTKLRPCIEGMCPD